jgi:hypothetical protein
MLIARHKKIIKSGLPFNTMLRELKDTVKTFHNSKPKLRISKRVRKKLDRRYIWDEQLRVVISHGKVQQQKQHTTSTRTGRRLLADHERKKTTLKQYKTLRVRYIRDNGIHIIVDAYNI